MAAIWKLEVPLRDKALWRLLYETAGRAEEILGLDVPDLDLPDRRGRVVSKGGAVDWVYWQTGAALLLPRLLDGRRAGPVFLTHEAEDGTSTPMLLARSRHASVRSLERYARPGPEAVARHVARSDPAARRPR